MQPAVARRSPKRTRRRSWPPAKLLKGEMQIYAGPMLDRDGTERIAAGEVMADPALWQMDWFVRE